METSGLARKVGVARNFRRICLLISLQEFDKSVRLVSQLLDAFRRSSERRTSSRWENLCQTLRQFFQKQRIGWKAKHAKLIVCILDIFVSNRWITQNDRQLLSCFNDFVLKHAKGKQTKHYVTVYGRSTDFETKLEQVHEPAPDTPHTPGLGMADAWIKMSCGVMRRMKKTFWKSIVSQNYEKTNYDEKRIEGF